MTFHEWKWTRLVPKCCDREGARATRSEASATVTNVAVEEVMEIEAEENIDPQETHKWYFRYFVRG